MALLAYFKNSILGSDRIPAHARERLNPHQVTLIMTGVAAIAFGWSLLLKQ